MHISVYDNRLQALGTSTFEEVLLLHTYIHTSFDTRIYKIHIDT